MATNTKNFKFKKPDESDFYDVQDQNGNWDAADEELEKLNTPTFEDYSGSTSLPEASSAIDGIKSGFSLPTLLSNIKAAFKGACLLGHIVNNCVTNRSDLPLSAAQGKALQDAITKLNGDFGVKLTKGSLFTVILSASYNISPNSTVDVSASCVRNGYVALGIVGLSGLTSNCTARQFFLSELEAFVSVYNRSSTNQSGTCNIRVLYRAE